MSYPMDVEKSTGFGTPVDIIDTAASWRKRKSDIAGNDEDQEVKRRKRRWQRKAGKLSLLMDMPMDVLFEIFSHLLPLDILYLARTTKEFRSVLMHKSSASIWKAARANVPGFPECPEYMTEIEYANLAFSRHCHVCLAPTQVRTIEWIFRVRLCIECSKTQLVSRIHREYGDPNWHIMIARRRVKRFRSLYFEGEISQVKRHYQSLETVEARNAYVRDRVSLVEQVEHHVPLCESWLSSVALGRCKEREEAIMSRKSAIVQRLSELGWADEIEHPMNKDCLAHHKLVNQPLRLTERIWSNISATMVKYMEEMRAKRLEREMNTLISKRKITAIRTLQLYKILHLPQTEPLFESADFCQLDVVRQILQLPPDIDVGHQHLARIIDTMPYLIGQWRQSVDMALVKVVKGNKTDEDLFFSCLAMESDSPTLTDSEAEARLNLATTVFKCQSCSSKFRFNSIFFDASDRSLVEPLFYPRVISHKCNTRFSLPLTDKSFAQDSDQNDPSRVFRDPMIIRRVWSSEHLEVDVKAALVVERIVLASGLDPKATSAGEMDAFDRKLGCLECIEWVHDYVEIEMFGWRDAVRHAIHKHGNENVRWSLLLPEEVASARVVGPPAWYTNMFPSNPKNLPVVWACTRCLDTPLEPPLMLLEDVKDHINKTHHVSDPKLNRDYFEDYAAPEIYLRNRTPPRMVVNIPFQVGESCIW